MIGEAHFLTEKEQNISIQGRLAFIQGITPGVVSTLSRLLNLFCGIVLIHNCLDNLNTWAFLHLVPFKRSGWREDIQTANGKIKHSKSSATRSWMASVGYVSFGLLTCGVWSLYLVWFVSVLWQCCVLLQVGSEDGTYLNGRCPPSKKERTHSLTPLPRVDFISTLSIN